jgi:hypothetical protein
MRILAAAFRVVFSVAACAPLDAAIWYVDGTNGADSSNGLTPATALRTIQRAADSVNPGDTVLIQPGIYPEHVVVSRTGTAAQPITFRAAAPGAIVSGADIAIRSGQVVWTLENASSDLYSTPLPFEPATVVADDVDLFPYATLTELQNFTLASANGSGLPAPGPQHGFAFADGKLYVRLNARYGLQHPAAHVMKVSGPRAGGFRGDAIQQPSDYCLSVQTTAPAYVIFDGFTCESPGFAGVWIQFGNVTVRNCTFIGCRTGVRGWSEAENQPTLITQDVIVQGCEFSQYPSWQDMFDVVAAAEALPADQRAALPSFFWWSRKSGTRTSEIGLTTAGGLRWKILGNYIHDTIDGLSFLAIGWTDQCEVAYNRFERLIDNAVEAENHSQHLRVHHNFVRDVFEPFSYQPNAGPPFPGSTWFYHNIVTLTPEATGFWRKSILKWVPGCVKVKPTGSSFLEIGLDGLLVFNNTIYFPSGNAITLGSVGASAATIRYCNNIVIARNLQTEVTNPSFAGTVFSHNVVATSDPAQPGPGAVFAGTGGQVFSDPSQIGFEDFASGHFALAPGSAAIGAGERITGVEDSSADAGALPASEIFNRFDQWRFRYFYDRLVGFPESLANADPDGDGILNIMECVLGRNPLGTNAAAISSTGLDAAGHLVLTFTRRIPLPEDVAWGVETSGNLVTWTSGAGVTETLPPTPAGNGLQIERVRDPAAGPRFLRLKATQLDMPPGAVPINDPPPLPSTGDILVDGFTDGGRSSGIDALDTAWYAVQAPSGGTRASLSVAADASLGGGNALFVNNVTDPAQTMSKSVVGGFTRVALNRTGDQLTLSFDFRFTNIAANNALNAFRIGLYDDAGKPITGDNQFIAPPAHSGYMASMNFGTIAGIPLLLKETGTAGNINSDIDISTVASFSGPSLALTSSAQKYSAVFTLTKSVPGISFRLQILDASGAAIFDSTVSDTSPSQGTFNEVLFSTSQSEADYAIDNVKVNYTPAP